MINLAVFWPEVRLKPEPFGYRFLDTWAEFIYSGFILKAGRPFFTDRLTAANAVKLMIMLLERRRTRL